MTKVYENCTLLKRLVENEKEMFGFQKKALQRNIAITKRLLDYAVERTREMKALARVTVQFGCSGIEKAKDILEMLIEEGDVKREGELIVYGK